MLQKLADESDKHGEITGNSGAGFYNYGLEKHYGVKYNESDHKKYEWKIN